MKSMVAELIVFVLQSFILSAEMAIARGHVGWVMLGAVAICGALCGSAALNLMKAIRRSLAQD